MDKKKFGIAIRENRDKMGLTQMDCANHCGVSIVAFQNWERGSSAPKAGKMELICAFLGLNKEDYE